MRPLRFRAPSARVLSFLPLFLPALTFVAGCGVDTTGLMPPSDVVPVVADAGDPRADAGDSGQAVPSRDTDADGVVDALDCAPYDSHAWVRVDAYADEDGDGIGAGPVTKVCGSANYVPAGYSKLNTDCAPTNALLYVLRDYTFRDADGDGATVTESGAVCSGADLPKGYTNAALAPDCDDTNAAAWTNVTAWIDADGDGYGAGPSVVQCTAGAPSAGYAARDGDCDPLDSARFQSLPYTARDADADGVTVAEAGNLCTGVSLPPGYALAPPGNDCNDHDASASALQLLYVDTDGDGVGAGAVQSLCLGTTPAGFSTTGSDCAPTDPLAFNELGYAYRDVDGDHYTVAASGVICTGNALPATYLPSADLGPDCDDTSAARFRQVTVYVDADGDGDGAGSSSVACTAGAAPTGYSLNGTDCAPTDPTLRVALPYGYVDRDGDGQTVVESGALCANAPLPKPYATTATGLDCDDADAAKTHFAVIFPDADGDGVGGGQYVIECIGAALPVGYSPYGDDEDDGDPAKKDDPELFESVLLPVLLASKAP